MKKTCKKCGLEKEISCFQKRSGRPSYRNECKDCQKKYLHQLRSENVEKIRENRRKKYIENRSENVKPHEKHGMYLHPAFSCWGKMKTRCSNPKNKEYPNYGGRGIKVCDRWKKFSNFWEDMGATWKSGLSIDRIDNDGNYEPGNCRWATAKIQSRNKRWNVKLTHNGKTMILMDWSKETGIIFPTLCHRIRAGWSTERILTTPVGLHKGRHSVYQIPPSQKPM